jgi:molecular chaperone DnaK (HSP70)
MKQIYGASGNDLGGSQVDAEFLQLLKRVLGEKVIEAAKKNNPPGWLEFVCKFEQKKKGLTSASNERLSVDLPYSLHEAAMEVTQKKVAQLIGKNNPHNVTCINQQTLVCNAKAIAGIFERSVKGIIEHTKRLMRDAKLRNISYILMVGGFSECSILQTVVKKEFGSRFKVIIPENARLCVLKGAVAFGHNPKAITTRVVRMTYGIDVCEPYDPSKHGVSKDHVEVIMNREYATGVLDIFVRRGDSIKVGEEKKLIREPVEPDQKDASFSLFSSERVDVKYKYDKDVHDEGSWKTPLQGEGLGRKVEIKISFGETELFVQSRQILPTKGKWDRNAFEFLTHGD